MDVKQGPFSLYDFLGYFVPGASSIFILNSFTQKLGLSIDFPNLTSWAKASELLPFVLVSYLIGHLFSLVSSFTVERYFIWSFGYPSKSLVGYSHDGYFLEGNKIQAGNVLRFFVGIFLLPISILDLILTKIFKLKSKIKNPLDNLLQNIIHGKFSFLIVDYGQIDRPNDFGRPLNSDYFRMVYHYVLENCPAHVPKMQNYVALFGFNRAVCLIFIVAFWLAFGTLIFDDSPEVALQIMFLSWVLSGVFFLGFCKFYRRYNLEALMALAANYKVPSHLVENGIPPAADVAG